MKVANHSPTQAAFFFTSSRLVNTSCDVTRTLFPTRKSYTRYIQLHPISPKVRKFEGSRVRRFFSLKVRKLEKKGSGVRTKRFCSPKVQNSEIMKYAIFLVINTRS